MADFESTATSTHLSPMSVARALARGVNDAQRGWIALARGAMVHVGSRASESWFGSIAVDQHGGRDYGGLRRDAVAIRVAAEAGLDRFLIKLSGLLDAQSESHDPAVGCAGVSL